MKTACALLIMSFVLLFPESMRAQPEQFHIEVQRARTKGALVIGEIRVNGAPIGNTYENGDLMIPAGSYPGLMRYVSHKNFVQGPFGTLSSVGDFLIEIANVEGGDRTDILFHGGNLPKHSTGCILLGAVGKDPITGVPGLPQDHPLYRLRKLFYGSDTPNVTPDKQITIDVYDIPSNEARASAPLKHRRYLHRGTTRSGLRAHPHGSDRPLTLT